jgi:hypothetical protein
VLTTYVGLLLRDLLDLFEGDVTLAVSGYNGGPARPNLRYGAGVHRAASHATPSPGTIGGTERGEGCEHDLDTCALGGPDGAQFLLKRSAEAVVARAGLPAGSAGEDARHMRLQSSAFADMTYRASKRSSYPYLGAMTRRTPSRSSLTLCGSDRSVSGIRLQLPGAIARGGRMRLDDPLARARFGAGKFVVSNHARTAIGPV